MGFRNGGRYAVTQTNVCGRAGVGGPPEHGTNDRVVLASLGSLVVGVVGTLVATGVVQGPGSIEGLLTAGSGMAVGSATKETTGGGKRRATMYAAFAGAIAGAVTTYAV